MSSLYLQRLSSEERDRLEKRLLEIQHSVCFICEKTIDLRLHKGNLDIDHIVPVSGGGKDDPSNFGLTHSSCNRSKLASNLEVARVLHRFHAIRDSLGPENRAPNLCDVLRKYGGSKHDIRFECKDGAIRYSLPEVGQNEIVELPTYTDKLSDFRYFFSSLPIEYLHHDDRINPRSIGTNVSKLIQEFHLRRPLLHPPLGWIDITDSNPSTVRVFDGQHKAAAQVLLGVRSLPVRVFINPDAEVLLKTNLNAGTTLRQVAFDRSVQRHLGSTLYLERIDRYKEDRGLDEDDFSFSERDLVAYFKGESREMRRYVLDSVRDFITHHNENRLRDYVDFGGRKTERPLSYSNIEKTFYSFFIYRDMLDKPLDYRLDEGANPRQLERDQILQLMNIIAEEIFIGRFDPDLGTSRIENRIQRGEEIPLDHIRAFRMSREEILYNWLRYIEQIIKNYFIMQGIPIDESKLFQYPFPDQIWARIRTFICSLRDLPLWVNIELSQTVFGGKQNYDFWQTIFESGRSPQGVSVLVEPLNLMHMIQQQ